MNLKFVTIASYRDFPQAGLDRSILEEHHIQCYLENEFTVGVNWLYSNALGGIKLKVLESNAARAGEILRDFHAVIAEEDSGEEAQIAESTCPKCGGGAIEAINYTRKFAAISLLFSLPLFFFLNRYRCRQCGHRWK